MRCQVRDILSFVAPNVLDSGVCPTSAQGIAITIEALDLGVEALMNRIDSEGTLWEWDVPVCQGVYPLPEDCRSDRQVFVNGFTATQRDEWFLGKLRIGQNYCGTCCSGPECIDLGEFVIPMALPSGIRGIRPAFVAQNDGDAGKQITVEVMNEYSQRVQETLTLLPNQQAVATSSVAYDVTYVGKPETVGPIALQLQFDNGSRLQWGSYGPKTRSGTFRRKRMPQTCWGCSVARIKGKMRYTRITSETDIIPICNRRALSFAVSAIAAMRGKRYDEYNQALGFAINELAREMQDVDPPAAVAQMHFSSGNTCNPSWAANNRAFV